MKLFCQNSQKQRWFLLLLFISILLLIYLCLVNFSCHYIIYTTGFLLNLELFWNLFLFWTYEVYTEICHTVSSDENINLIMFYHLRIKQKRIGNDLLELVVVVSNCTWNASCFCMWFYHIFFKYFEYSPWKIRLFVFMSNFVYLEIWLSIKKVLDFNSGV